MDWKIFITTFITIFLAEVGDKTQFAAIAAGAEAKSTASVWLAVVLALSTAGTMGVVFGRVLNNYLDPVALKWVSGCLFIAVGVWILVAKK